MGVWIREYAHRFYYGLLVASMLLVVFAGAVSVHSARAMAQAVEAAKDSQLIVEQAHQVLAVYGDTESFGLRWAMSFDDAMWERFQIAMRRLDLEAGELATLVADDPEQRARADALLAAVARRHEHGRRAWPVLREGGIEATTTLLRTGAGMRLGDEIRDGAFALITRENANRAEREERFRERMTRATATVVAATGLALVGGLVGVLATTQSRRAWLREREADFQREKAEAASRQKSLFLATMSHEIRTPMNAIFGFSQLLARRVHDPKSLEYVRAIRASGQSLLALINDLLDLSKIEAGRMELHLAPTDLRELLDSTLSVFAEPAAGKGLRLSADIDPFLPKAVLVDPHRLRQVLMNLVSNAIKYTDRGTVRLRLDVTPKDAQRADIVFVIEDTGIGIDEGQLLRIFDPFHRITSERGERIEGTGLGLSIVRRLVELMGGRIDVRSEVGKGSAFSVHLDAVEVVPSSAATLSLRPSHANFANLAPARILVVDDVPLNRELLGAYLADSGHELAFADDGIAAIEMVTSWRPTVVLMDIRMPKLDGRTAAERIRALEEGRRICLVAVTASSMSSDERLLRQVFDAYLRKPVSPNDLYQCLLELIGTRRNPEGCSTEVQKAQDRHAAAEQPPSADERSRAEPAIAALESALSTRLVHVQKTMRMRELKVFADDIADLGQRGGLPRIADYAQRLNAAIDGFDMTTIDSLLEQLPRHVAAERNRLENP